MTTMVRMVRRMETLTITTAAAAAASVSAAAAAAGRIRRGTAGAATRRLAGRRSAAWTKGRWGRSDSRAQASYGPGKRHGW